MTKYLTFDITNTLIKVNGGVGSAYSKIVSKFNYNLDENLTNLNFRKYFKLQNQNHPGYGFSQGMKSKDWWSFIVRNILIEDSKSKSIKLDAALIEKISDEVFDEFSKETYWKKCENCDHVLNVLRNEHNFRMGVISNFDERLFHIMRNLNIYKYFDFICIPSNSNGSYKPQAEIFKQARDRFEITRENKNTNKSVIIHVGDDLKLDYEAAIKSNLNYRPILMLNNAENDKKKLENNNQLNVATNLNNLLHQLILKHN